MTKVVFIDIDNTLLSFSEYVKDAMRNGFREFGLKEYQEEMFPIFHRENDILWCQIEKGELTLQELEKIRWNNIFKALDIEFDGVVFEAYFRKYLFSSAIPENGALELLSYLRERGYILCAASNGPYEQQLNRLRIGGMYDYFTHFFISEQVGAQKPSQVFFEYCFKELRANGMPELMPEETMIIGDSLTSDMAGGINYGMKTCLYSKKKHRKEEIEKIDYVVTDLQAITNIL